MIEVEETPLNYSVSLLREVRCETCQNLIGRYPTGNDEPMRHDLIHHMRIKHHWHRRGDGEVTPLGE